jgi:hypothetical protein
LEMKNQKNKVKKLQFDSMLQLKQETNFQDRLSFNIISLVIDSGRRFGAS